MEKQKKKGSSGITLVALVVSIVVMLILAGVSINAVVGDNGIITQAQSATYATSRAVLEEWINQLYVENYDDFSEYDNKMEAFLSSSYADYFYNPSEDGDTDGTTYGSVAYVVDSDGHALYLIKKSALPDDIKSQITGGDAGDGNYADYLALTDVYGVTSDLKVYYCSNGTDTILGVSEDELDSDNINRTVTISDSGLKSLLSSYAEADGTIKASSLRSVKKLTIDSSVSSLSDLYNLTSLQELTIDGATLSNLSGIQNCTQLYYVYFKSSTVGDYSAMANLGSKLQYLYFYNIDDDELSTACTGLASAEFGNLEYLAVVGNVNNISTTFTSVDHSSYSEKSTNTITSLEPLSKLSSTTKNAVKYLSIQNNNISGDLSAISDYSNLILLRCEYNSLTSLNGLANTSNLKYLCGAENQLGATAGTDSEGNSTIVAEDASTGTAISNLSSKTNLMAVNLVNNSYLANVNYFENLEDNIKYLYLAGCSTSMNVNKITDVILACGINYSLPVTFSTSTVYTASNYYTIPTTAIASSDSLYTSISSDLKNNTYITCLNLEGVIFETDSMYQDILSTMTNLEYVTLKGCTNLASIDFVGSGKVTKLVELDLRDTSSSLTDLTNLNDYGTSLTTLRISNTSTNLTDIQETIGRLSTTSTYWDTSNSGFCFTNIKIFEKLAECEDLEQLYVNMYSIEVPMGGDVDLSSMVSLKNYSVCGVKGGYVVILPASVKSVLCHKHFVELSSETNTISSFSVAYFSNSVDGYASFSRMANSLSNCEGIGKLSLNTVQGIENYFSLFTSVNLPVIGSMNVSCMSSYTENMKLYALTGISNWLSSATTLSISRIYSLTDFSELASCTTLTTLTIDNTNLSDISFVSTLTNLQTLTLNNNAITSLKSLETLTSLTTLDLKYNAIYDTATYTDDSGTEITYNNLQILANLYEQGALRTLYISGNKGITNYSLITACKDLTTDL